MLSLLHRPVVQLIDARGVVARQPWDASQSGRRPSGFVDAVAVNSLSNTKYWQGSLDAGPKGSATMSFGAVFRCDTASLARDQTFIDNFVTATCGYRLRLAASVTRAQATVVSSAPANVVESNNLTIANGSCYTLLAVLGGGGLSIYRNGVLMSAAQAVTGYTAPTASARPEIGKNQTGAGEVSIMGVVVADATALDATAALAWHNNVVATLTYGFASGTTHLWDARDVGASTWVDQVAGVSLSKVSTPATETFTPSFGA